MHPAKWVIRLRSIVCVVVILCASAVANVCAQEAPGVIVATVTLVDFPLTVEALGTAGANESVTIRPKIAETVTAIRFTEGELLKAGEVLIELEDAEARAAVAAAKAALLDAESKFKRNQELFRSELVPESQVETSEAQRDAASAALDAAEARLRDTVLRAPFAGRVGLRRVSLGSLVGPSTVITTLDDTRTIKLDFDVPETALSQLETGLKVIAHSAAWPEVNFEGTVEAIDTRVDPVSRTLTVRALIPNPEFLLRPGMFMRVELMREDVKALMIPEQAIVPEQSRQFVFVVDEQNVVSKRQVSIGRRRPGQVEITSGVEPGETVIVEGTQKVKPGSRVEVIRRMEVTP